MKRFPFKLIRYIHQFVNKLMKIKIIQHDLKWLIGNTGMFESHLNWCCTVTCKCSQIQKRTLPYTSIIMN